MATIPLTRRGAEKLKEELHRLKSVERHAVIQAIAEARAQGDLSENAEYEAAKDKQGFIEGRIKELESKLAAARPALRRERGDWGAPRNRSWGWSHTPGFGSERKDSFVLDMSGSMVVSGPSAR